MNQESLKASFTSPLSSLAPPKDQILSLDIANSYLNKERAWHLFQRNQMTIIKNSICLWVKIDKKPSLQKLHLKSNRACCKEGIKNRRGVDLLRGMHMPWKVDYLILQKLLNLMLLGWRKRRYIKLLMLLQVSLISKHLLINLLKIDPSSLENIKVLNSM